MKTDIQFESDGWMFNCRAVGICVKNGSIFLSRLVSDQYWTFIGGKAALGENTKQAVLREYEEEFLGERQIADEKEGVYRWFTLDEIKHIPIKPDCFHPLLESLPTDVLHIINHEF